MFEDRVFVAPHRVSRAQAYQGHLVPDHGYYPSFGFESDVPTIIDNPDPVEEFPLGATAQNNMQGVVFYQCQGCGAVVREEDCPGHRCEDTDGASY